MFIKKLYRYSKAVFFVFAAFIIAFVFINYKWGVVATPVYQYGMFSSVFHVSDTQVVYHIYVNDKHLDITKYAMAKRDMMLISLENYEKAKEINQPVFFTMKRILDKTGLGYLMSQPNYSNNINDTVFSMWYKKLLQKTTGFPVVKIAVFSQKYVWVNNLLNPVSSPEKLSFLVAD